LSIFIYILLVVALFNAIAKSKRDAEESLEEQDEENTKTRKEGGRVNEVKVDIKQIAKNNFEQMLQNTKSESKSHVLTSPEEETKVQMSKKWAVLNDEPVLKSNRTALKVT
jgi:hypothetical protein